MSVRAASRRSIVCAIVGATLAILAGVCARGASAHFQTYPYTLTACPASYEHQVDPVTDVFYGAATGARVLNHIRFHTGWTDAGGSTQYFSSEGVCGATYWGNTREFKQCDGDYAGSNGYVDWWRIPAWSH